MSAPDRSIQPESLTDLVETLAPDDWRLVESTPASGGFNAVYHCLIETPGGTRDAVLKTSTDEHENGIDVESRVLTLLDAKTRVPVPEVYGALDGHADLPAPGFLMEHILGRAVDRRDLASVDRGTFRSVVRQAGRHLAGVHRLDVVDAYGFLERDPGVTLRGERPPTTPDSFRVTDPTDSWPATVREWADEKLDPLTETRFGDVAEAVTPVLHERIDDLSGPFSPSLGHTDCQLENTLHDPDIGEVTGMIDWAFTLAVTPAYDLVSVGRSMAGGPWAFVPGTADVRGLVRDALLAGYREAGGDAVVEQYRRNADCYELLYLVRTMSHLEEWLGMKGATDEQMHAAATRMRTLVAEHC